MEAKTTVLHASHTSLLSHPDRVAAVTEETAAAVSQQAALGIYLAFFLVGLALGWAFPLPSFELRLGQFVVGVIAFASLVIAGLGFTKFVFPVGSLFRPRVSHHLDHATFPASAASNAACGFPALRSPVCFASRLMGPILPEPLSARVVQPK